MNKSNLAIVAGASLFLVVVISTAIVSNFTLSSQGVQSRPNNVREDFKAFLSPFSLNGIHSQPVPAQMPVSYPSVQGEEPDFIKARRVFWCGENGNDGFAHQFPDNYDPELYCQK